MVLSKKNGDSWRRDKEYLSRNRNFSSEIFWKNGFPVGNLVISRYFKHCKLPKRKIHGMITISWDFYEKSMIDCKNQRPLQLYLIGWLKSIRCHWAIKRDFDIFGRSGFIRPWKRLSIDKFCKHTKSEYGLQATGLKKMPKSR